MFRKIRSNRNPRDTLYSELKKEWGPYLSKLRLSLQNITRRYPRFLFAMMVINILLSVVLVVSLHRPPPKKQIDFKPILQASQALRKTIVLKRFVDSIMGKKQLSKQDSATLEKALDELQILKKQNP